MSNSSTELYVEHFGLSIACAAGEWFIPVEDEPLKLNLVGRIEVPEPIYDLIISQTERVALTRFEFIEGCYVRLRDINGLFELL